MKLQDYSKEAQAVIGRLAEKLTISREEVIARFDELFAGRPMSKHSGLFFAA